jgi:hypothetical protein
LVGTTHPKELFHFLVEKSTAGAVGLYPFAIDNELGDSPFAYVLDNLLRGARAGLDIDLGVGNLVLIKKPFGLAAIAAPRSGIHQNMHPSIIPTANNYA